MVEWCEDKSGGVAVDNFTTSLIDAQGKTQNKTNVGGGRLRYRLSFFNKVNHELQAPLLFLRNVRVQSSFSPSFVSKHHSR